MTRNTDNTHMLSSVIQMKFYLDWCERMVSRVIMARSDGLITAGTYKVLLSLAMQAIWFPFPIFVGFIVYAILWHKLILPYVPFPLFYMVPAIVIFAGFVVRGYRHGVKETKSLLVETQSLL